MYRSAVETRRIFAYWMQRAEGYKDALARDGGLPVSDHWRLEYCSVPYLMLASNEYLAARWLDHFHNNVRLTRIGEISLRDDFSDASSLFGPLFSHLEMEYGTRGGIPVSLAVEAREQISKYFRNGVPIGVSLFEGYPETLNNVIVRFGKRQHIEAMLHNGEVRVTPSNFYSNASLSSAVRDLECEREFHIPAFKSVFSGETHASTKNSKRVKIEDGFVKEVRKSPNYVLWCACLDIDRRMPDDFEADAALIIKKPNSFASRFKSKLLEVWPGVKVKFGPVEYYDPCSFVHMDSKTSHLKHFRYAYQREWRLCAFPSVDQLPNEAFNIHLGSLDDIAELVTLKP